jgi:hypothetical protein
MEMNRRTFVATLLAGAFSARSLLAADKHKDEGEWEKLGEKAVSKQEERDVIDVKGTTRYTALSFRVEKGDVEIDDIKVTFDNDKTFSPNTKAGFPRGRAQQQDRPARRQPRCTAHPLPVSQPRPEGGGDCGVWEDRGAGEEVIASRTK